MTPAANAPARRATALESLESRWAANEAAPSLNGWQNLAWDAIETLRAIEAEAAALPAAPAAQTREPRTAAVCKHLRIETYRNDTHGTGLWACSDCKRRFYPACEKCITVGHREGHEAAALPADKPEPSVQAEPAGLDVERLRRAICGYASADPDHCRDEAEQIAAAYAEGEPER